MSRPLSLHHERADHLFWPAALRFFSETISVREDRRRPPAPARDRRRNRFLFSRQRSRPARDDHRVARRAHRRRALLQFPVREQDPETIFTALCQTTAAGVAGKDRATVAELRLS